MASRVRKLTQTRKSTLRSSGLGVLVFSDRGSAAFVEMLNQSSRLVCNLVFPKLQVLEGVCGGKHLALARVILLVNHIGQVIVGSGGDNIKGILSALCVVAVYIVDSTYISVGQGVWAYSDDRMFLVHFCKVSRALPGVCEYEKGDAGYAGKRGYVGQST